MCYKVLVWDTFGISFANNPMDGNVTSGRMMNKVKFKVIG